MNIGFVFLALALASVATSAGARYAPPANMGLGMQIVTVVISALAAVGFGLLAAVALLFGALS